MTAAALAARAREQQEIEALITDRYLESILLAHGRGADVAPVLVDAQPDRAIALAVRRLARDLPRVHPSFRFEEALAARLQEAAARMRMPAPAFEADDAIVAIAGRRPDDRFTRPGRDERIVAPGDPRLVIGRPWLVGGALTSAALSIAGVAYVAWRIRRPQASPMARAARAVSRARLA